MRRALHVAWLCLAAIGVGAAGVAAQQPVAGQPELKVGDQAPDAVRPIFPAQELLRIACGHWRRRLLGASAGDDISDPLVHLPLVSPALRQVASDNEHRCVGRQARTVAGKHHLKRNRHTLFCLKLLRCGERSAVKIVTQNKLRASIHETTPQQRRVCPA